MRACVFLLSLWKGLGACVSACSTVCTSRDHETAADVFCPLSVCRFRVACGQLQMRGRLSRCCVRIDDATVRSSLCHLVSRLFSPLSLPLPLTRPLSIHHRAHRHTHTHTHTYIYPHFSPPFSLLGAGQAHCLALLPWKRSLPRSSVSSSHTHTHTHTHNAHTHIQHTYIHTHTHNTYTLTSQPCLVIFYHPGLCPSLRRSICNGALAGGRPRHTQDGRGPRALRRPPSLSRRKEERKRTRVKQREREK